ncbi:hypothetical protein ACWCXB_32550 [Streptomyces sp. NPDC001514]
MQAAIHSLWSAIPSLALTDPATTARGCCRRTPAGSISTAADGERAAETLPDAVVDPARMQWSAPPTTELRLSAEGPHDQPSPGLGTLIDLEALGPGEDGVRSEMAITITRSPTMHRPERQAVLRRALVHMARHFGYVWAEEELL